MDTVYHLAGETRDAELFDATNRLGTETLLGICRSAGVRRFVYLSSVGVMGAADSGCRVDEGTRARPRNAYETSKYAGEQCALRAHQGEGMQVSVLRPSIVYGEGKSRSSDSFLAWLRAVQTGRAFSLGHDYVSSYVYVGDVVTACQYLASHPITGGQVYIINEPIRLATFVGEMARLLAVQDPPSLPNPLGTLLAFLLRLSGRFGSLYNRTRYSMDKLSALGFVLPYGYREGLRRTVKWYQSQGLLAIPFA
jgi:UDP-glucose 4-epimerase